MQIDVRIRGAYSDGQEFSCTADSVEKGIEELEMVYVNEYAFTKIEQYKERLTQQTEQKSEPVEEGNKPVFNTMLHLRVKMAIVSSIPDPKKVTEANLNNLVQNMVNLIKSLK